MGRTDRMIHAIRYDSRRVQQGDVFIAIRGYEIDGNKFISSVIEKGASAIVTDDVETFEKIQINQRVEKEGVTCVLVDDSRIALAEFANVLYDFPTHDILLIGVTGTNGKTTTTHIVKHFLEFAGTRTGLIGTIESKFGETIIPMEHTTPESTELCEIISLMKEQGAQAVVMEVSSHALELHRVHGFEFDAAIFTNLTQDHLDFHGTMESYASAKSKLFQMLNTTATAVINADDQHSFQMEQATKAQVIRYGVVNRVDVKGDRIVFSANGTTMRLRIGTKDWIVDSPYLGMFNVYNLLGGVSAALAAGISDSVIMESIPSLPAVRGRMERVPLPNGAIAIVDYAHTPDALQRAIETAKMIVGQTGGKVITLFGCGGNRDSAKRPIMGEISSKLSDYTIVTSDNPRMEDPMAIISDVLNGVNRRETVSVIVDRGEAIEAALNMSRQNDVVLLAGKGHEDYQVIGTVKIHFDDLENVRAWVAQSVGASDKR